MSRHWLGLLLLGVWIGGGGVAHAAFTESPNPLDIGSVVVGQSNSTDATLSSNNQVTVNVALATGGDCSQFQITPAMVTVGPNQPADDKRVTVTFTPTSTGDKSCTVTVKRVSDMATLAAFTVKGKGIPQIAVVTPTTLTLQFNHEDVGQTSASLPVAIRNDGDAPLTISSATFTSGGTDYTISGGPTGPLTNKGDQATWNIACKPTAPGSRNDTFEIKSNSIANSTIDIALTCIGDQGILTINAPTIDFSAVPRGTTLPRTFVLTNIGNVDVGAVQITIDPPNTGYTPDPATVPTTIPASSPNNTKAVTVTFTPMVKTDGGNATITFHGIWGAAARQIPSLSLALTGIESSYALSPAQPTLDFGKFRYDTHSPMTFQLLNDGAATLMMNTPFIPDTGTRATEYKVDLANGAMPVTQPALLVADGHVTVVVTPQVDHRIGVVSGHIDIMPSVGAPLHVPITGIATAAEVDVPPTVSFGVVSLEEPPAMKTVTLTNTGSGTLDIMSFTQDAPGAPGPNPLFTITLPSMPRHLNPGEALDIPVVYRPMVATADGAPDMVILTVQLAGSVNGSATTQITGDAVFNEIHGGGGCNAGGAGRGGGLVVALAALIALRRRRRLATVAVASLAVVPAVRADGIGLNIFEPTPAITGQGFALQAPDVGARGSWAANAVVSYASNLLVFDSLSGGGGRESTALVERSTLLQLGAAYALLDRLELGARLPLYQQSGESGQAGQVLVPNQVHGTAFGDLALHAKARLWRGGTGAGALAAGASAVVMLPTASKGQFTGSDQPEARLLLLGSFTPAALGSRLALSVNAGAVLRQESRYANIEQKSGVAWGAGASVRILDELWATAELFGEATPSGQRQQPMAGAMPPPATLTQVEGLAGVMIRPERRITVGLALGRGLTRAPGTPDLRGVLSVSVVPGAAPAAPAGPRTVPAQEPDTDGDGIVDAQDKCPSEPEDRDGFQDADGCPDPDNDGDGIPDKMDKCPNDPEDKDGFQDADGCPDPDNDGDGIPDARDRCPNEPETVNGFQDDDGCPDSLPAADPAAATKAAEASFSRGRELMAQNSFAAACAAFEQSQRLDPQFGTQYNLAICYDKLGKLATAWNLYRELARSDTNPARRTRAGQAAVALAPRVPKLRLVLPKRPDGVQVLLNGIDAGALIGIEAPVDAGRYTVAATAPGHRPWQGTVQAQDGSVATVVIDLQPIH